MSQAKGGEIGVVGVTRGGSEEQVFVTGEAAAAEISSLFRNVFVISDEA